MTQLHVAAPTQVRGDASGSMDVLVWYPAPPATAEEPLPLGPPGHAQFDGGAVAFGAPVAGMQHPLIVLSHGTGGSAAMLAWLAQPLAASGYIVAAPNHPGNNALHPYTVQGFSLPWLRAGDLSLTIDALLASPRFAPFIDAHRIAAAGFSLGGYTMMEIAGARTDLAGLAAYCRTAKAQPNCAGPPEFPDLTARADALAEADPSFAAARADQGASYRDARVRSVFAIAPAIGPAVTAASLAAIAIPVAVVVGSNDTIAPGPDNAQRYAAAIPGATLEIVPDAGHYTFLDDCLAAGLTEQPLLCTDPPGADRARVHAHVADEAVAFFGRTLRAQQ